MELTYKEAQARAARARWANVSKEQRSEIARKAVQARWSKSKTGLEIPKEGLDSDSDFGKTDFV